MASGGVHTVRDSARLSVGDVAVASGGDAVVGGGEHARKNQFNYLVLRYEASKKFSSMYVG